MIYRARVRADLVHAFMAKLPRGAVWPRTPDSTLVRFVTGLLGVVERWARDVGVFLVIEAFPPTASLLLTDWERVLGLPEPCFPSAQTLEERRLQVREKLGRRPGGQSRAYFTGIAERLGYHHVGPGESDLGAPVSAQLERLDQITITEFRPFMCGVSRAGDPTWQIAPPKMRFLWIVDVPGERLTWFRCGAGRAGVDPHLTIRRADDLECILHKLKPGHTNLIFAYTGGLTA